MTITRSEAIIPTANGAKYVLQLAKHWSHKFEVTTTDNGTLIPFSEATQVSLVPSPDGINVCIDTTEADKVEQLQGVVFDHLARFAHREPLTAPQWTTTTISRD